MRTRILSLLLALLAISNFSLAQNKHFIHSVPFREATQELYRNDGEQNLVFQPEMDRGLPLQDLYCFTAESMDGTVTVGMMMDQNKYKHFFENFEKDNIEKTSDYIWVFVLDDFSERCYKKGLGKLKNNETNSTCTVETG